MISSFACTFALIRFFITATTNTIKAVNRTAPTVLDIINAISDFLSFEDLQSVEKKVHYRIESHLIRRVLEKAFIEK